MRVMCRCFSLPCLYCVYFCLRNVLLYSTYITLDYLARYHYCCDEDYMHFNKISSLPAYKKYVTCNIFLYRKYIPVTKKLHYNLMVNIEFPMSFISAGIVIMVE